jgi:hypothetical protein
MDSEKSSRKTHCGLILLVILRSSVIPLNMLVFFDETFRHSREHEGVQFGALCGIAIPEDQLTRVAQDIYQLKLKHLDGEYAREREIHGKELLKNFAFKLEARGIASRNLNLVRDIIHYICLKNLKIFGCVCFEKKHQTFECTNLTALDKTFRFVFERVDIFMKLEHQGEMASIIFDSRDFGTDQKNAHAITNYFLRSPDGLALDSIVDTPFFAISQSQNIGLQLADLVTTVIGMRFESHPAIQPFYSELKRCFFRWKISEKRWGSGLKLMRGG